MEFSQQSEELPASPDSLLVAPASLDPDLVVPSSMDDEASLDSDLVAPPSLDPLVGVVPASMDVEASLDSWIGVPASLDPFLDFVPASIDSEVAKTMMPEDSLPPEAFVCPRCQLIHEDRESWDRVHDTSRPCQYCGLVHKDYWMRSNVRTLDELDCAMAMDLKREMDEQAEIGARWKEEKRRKREERKLRYL